MSADVWVGVLERHFGQPRGSVCTTWGRVEVLTEAGYTTADCGRCRETFAGDADPQVVAQAAAGHYCDLDGAS